MDNARAARALPSLLSLLVMPAACAPTPPSEPPPSASAPRAPSPLPAPSTPAPASASVAPAKTSRLALSQASAPTVPAPHGGPLGYFHDALRELARGRRKAHVRILWLGDSHAQADFWTGYVREALQKRFGNAGPGFVHLGMKQYRHGGVDVDVKGSWRMRPKKPSTILPFGDGAFGLGGILHAGFAGARSATLAITDPGLAGRGLEWDICYKPGLASDKLHLSVGQLPRETIAAAKADVGKLLHLTRETPGPAALEVVQVAGRTDFCGVYVQTDPASHPGVIVDNLGINGARYATALAWNEQAWGREVARHPPDLFVLEYGGNEAGDVPSKPADYKKNALDLIARVKRLHPKASCLVVGPADRVDAADRIPPIRDALRAAAQESSWCMFWDTYQLMGGKGSLRKWRDDQLAAPDGVHLKPKGYQHVGALLLADVVKDMRP